MIVCQCGQPAALNEFISLLFLDQAVVRVEGVTHEEHKSSEKMKLFVVNPPVAVTVSSEVIVLS